MAQLTPDQKLTRAVEMFAGMKADDIAALMRRRKITGRPATTGNCPVAKLLHGVIGGQFVIGQKFMAVQSGSKVIKLPTPAHVALFVRKFDSSEYPSLLQPPPRVTRAVDARKGDRHIVRKPSTLPKKRRAYRCHPAQEVGRLTRG